MLPCICPVIDHRWRQNVVRTKKWHTRHSWVCHWCSYHILTSFVIYYWTDARQHEIYLFYIITRQITTDKTFFSFISKSSSKSRPLPTLANTNKPFDVISNLAYCYGWIFSKTMALLLSVLWDFSVRCREITLEINRIQSANSWWWHFCSLREPTWENTERSTGAELVYVGKSKVWLLLYLACAGQCLPA